MMQLALLIALASSIPTASGSGSRRTFEPVLSSRVEYAVTANNGRIGQPLRAPYRIPSHAILAPRTARQRDEPRTGLSVGSALVCLGVPALAILALSGSSQDSADAAPELPRKVGRRSKRLLMRAR